MTGNLFNSQGACVGVVEAARPSSTLCALRGMATGVSD